MARVRSPSGERVRRAGLSMEKSLAVVELNSGNASIRALLRVNGVK